MSNLPRRPSARVFWNSAKLRTGETPAKRRPQKPPWCECHHVLIKISLKWQPSTTFCCKPRLPKCPWSWAMSNLARRPSARVFWNSAKLRPGKTPAKIRTQKTLWRESYHFVIRVLFKGQLSTTFCCKPPAQHFAANHGSQSAHEAELCQICQEDPQPAFSKVLQSCDQGKLLQKEGHKKHPSANAIMFSLKFP